MELAHTPASSSGATKEPWTEEEIKVGDSLIHEFRQAGMALGESVQAQYRQISRDQQHLCARLLAFEVPHPAAAHIPLQTLCVSQRTSVVLSSVTK